MKICTPVARRSIPWQCNVCHAWCLYSESVWTKGSCWNVETPCSDIRLAEDDTLCSMQKLPQVSLLSGEDTESTSGKTRLALLESHPGNDQFNYLWSTPGLTFQRCKAQLLQQPSKPCNQWHGQPHTHLWKTLQSKPKCAGRRQDTFGSASIKGEQQSLREAFLTEGHESRTGVCKVILIVVRTQVLWMSFRSLWEGQPNFWIFLAFIRVYSIWMYMMYIDVYSICGVRPLWSNRLRLRKRYLLAQSGERSVFVAGLWSSGSLVVVRFAKFCHSNGTVMPQ